MHSLRRKYLRRELVCTDLGENCQSRGNCIGESLETEKISAEKRVVWN